MQSYSRDHDTTHRHVDSGPAEDGRHGPLGVVDVDRVERGPACKKKGGVTDHLQDSVKV